MADIFYPTQRVMTMAALLLLLSSSVILQVLAVNPPFTVPCGEYSFEECLDLSPPSCEPTCYDDCSYSTGSPVPLVHDPTCVCKPGFVRDNNVCIAKESCYDLGLDDYGIDQPGALQCSPSEDLLQSPPCCEPTCSNDCSNIVCPLVFIDEPTCVCKTGLVRQNGICIDPRQCVPEAPGQATEYGEYYSSAVAIPVAIPVPYDNSIPAPPAVYTDVSYINQPAVCGGAVTTTTTVAPPPCVVTTPAPCQCQQQTPAPCACQSAAAPCLPPPPVAPCPCQAKAAPCYPPPPVAPPASAPCNGGCMPPPPIGVPNPCGFCRRNF
ncbi:hypothetical protein pipiens_001855 [Culex pipiens pipiens]|uniref:Uncharacterized protein n=1 Tax=Culex pipiens pipiens TaxID=38569 RepID=A0ABD1DSI3_CULPP